MIISLKITKIIISKSLVIIYNTYHTKDKKKLLVDFVFVLGILWHTFEILVIFGLAHSWQEKGRICHGLHLTTNHHPPIDKQTHKHLEKKLIYKERKLGQLQNVSI